MVFAEQFSELKQADLKVSRAWAIKESFRDFWDYRYAGWARRHFDKWYARAIRCRLEPIKEKARMLKNHLPHILTCFKHRISNRDYIQKYKPSRRMPGATALSMDSETASYFTVATWI